jgi:hypothetical protein
LINQTDLEVEDERKDKVIDEIENKVFSINDAVDETY